MPPSLPSRLRASADINSTPRRVSAGIQFLRATPLRTTGVALLPSDGQHLLHSSGSGSIAVYMRVCLCFRLDPGSRVAGHNASLGPDPFGGRRFQVMLAGCCYKYRVVLIILMHNPSATYQHAHMPPRWGGCACFACMTDRQIGKANVTTAKSRGVGSQTHRLTGLPDL